jgi:hypothetical protein
MAKISETELQRRLRSLENRVPAGGSGGSSYVGTSEPSGTNYDEGDSHYDSTLNNLWIFSEGDWDLSNKQLHWRYATSVTGVDDDGKVANQNQVTGFSDEPFYNEGQKLWRGFWWGSSLIASTDPTDYEWSYTSGLGAIAVQIYSSQGNIFKNDTGVTSLRADVSIGGTLSSTSEHNNYNYKWTYGNDVVCVDSNGNIVSDGLGNIYTDTTAVSCQSRSSGYHRADSNNTTTSAVNFRTVILSADDVENSSTIRCEVSDIP